MSALRYVVLHHTGIDRPHYDLMFERDPHECAVTRALLRLAAGVRARCSSGLAIIADRIWNTRGPFPEIGVRSIRVEAGVYSLQADRDDSLLLRPVFGNPNPHSKCRSGTGNKKGAVDLSAFHGTQGRRIVTLEYTIEMWTVFPILTKSIR